MAKSSGNYPIPFDEDGNQLHYAADRSWSPCRWLDNNDFEDELTFKDYSRGRSAAYFHLVKSDGKEVTMFLKELTEAIPHMERGVLRGKFRFIKRGQNYGCTLIEPSA